MASQQQIQDALNKSIMANVILSVVVLVLAGILIFTNLALIGIGTLAANNVRNVGNPTTTVSSTTGTLAGIDQPFNSSELNVINGAPLAYYEVAGQKLLNHSLNNQVIVSNSPQANAFIVNGKPSVIYIGAISCIFCGENRWAMALALGSFGKFSQLYKGYSALGDGDLPTIYWNLDNYTTASGATFGNFYNSSYINFISTEYDSPITGGFQMQPLSYFIPHAPNTTYYNALTFMNSTGLFSGTPFTFWGTSIMRGADAVVLGNTTPSGTPYALSVETHAQVLNQLSSFNDQFAWSEYAGADVYIAQVCPSINNAAPVCQLPAIIQIEHLIGVA